VTSHKGHLSASGTVLDTAQLIIGPQGIDMRLPAKRFAPGRADSEEDQAASLPPLILDGPTLDAPDCVADPDPRNHCADAP
jgi:hypothetical protein